MKVASAKLLTRYRIVDVPGETGAMGNQTENQNIGLLQLPELKFRTGNLIFIEFEDIVVRLEKRE